MLKITRIGLWQDLKLTAGDVLPAKVIWAVPVRLLMPSPRCQMRVRLKVCLPMVWQPVHPRQVRHW